MSDPRAESVVKRLEQMASTRNNFDTLFQQVAERVLPGESNFQGTREPGADRTEKMYDPTASLALKKYAAILESLGMPRTAEYHQLKPVSEELAEDWEVKAYFEEVNKLLFRSRYAPRGGFIGALGSLNLTYGAFGNGSLFVDEIAGQGTRYRAIPLAECFYGESHTGTLDTLYRRFQYTARQCAQAFGEEGLPAQIRTAYAQNPEQMFWLVHAVQPIAEAEGKRYPRGARFTSVYVSQDYKATLREGHYFTFPYPTARDVTMAGEVYARGPAVWVLPGIKMLNEMKRTIIRAGHKTVDPPLLLTEDGALNGFSLRPGALNAGALDANGNELVKPLQSGARLDIGFEMLEAEQKAINESFYVTLLQVVVDHPQMTATEALQRAQEQGMLLGPVIGRQQEFLGALVERELDLLARANRLPPMPDALVEAGGEYKIEYDSPLTRIQRSGDALAITRTLEVAMPYATAKGDPAILDNFDDDAIARTLAEVNGMPTKLTRPPEAVAAIREQRARQQAAMAAAEMAPGMARAAKDVSEVAAA